MNQLFERFSKRAILSCASALFFAGHAFAQAPPEKPTEKPQEKPAETPAAKPEEPPNAAQIELLETKYRFETNGDSRKEVRAVVKINNELGVRQFARLNFDYNRSFQSVEIPLVHITHASGGTADILPSAISDVPNPVVEKFPAYQDVRVKSVRILGLQPGDSLEYRVVTMTTHHPLAPNFWLSHSFDRTGVASKQLLELDLPKFQAIQLHANTAIPSAALEDYGTDKDARHVYRWSIVQKLDASAEESESDVVITTFASWGALANAIDKTLMSDQSIRSEVLKKAAELAGARSAPEKKIHAVYDFVSQKISTVDLPLGTSGFRTRQRDEILASGYATAEDKFALFDAMIVAFEAGSSVAFTGSTKNLANFLPTPTALSNLLVVALIRPELSPGEGCDECSSEIWLDPTIEVAPFGVIPASLRGRQALGGRAIAFAPDFPVQPVPDSLPFASTQNVTITAGLGMDGTLKAKVKYILRGDNELLLRVTFHQTPKEKQLQIAQYLALSDGFRGKVTSVKTSDPYAADVPFEVEYELTQEKFVDWSKNPVRIPALLPLPGLPDVAKKPNANSKIELGTPLNIELSGSLRLPPGVTAQSPAGTSVKRDYATFASAYSATANLLRFSRHLKFLAQEIPTDRSIDLNAFIHAVQSDQSQIFTLGGSPTAPKSPKPSTAPTHPSGTSKP